MTKEQLKKQITKSKGMIQGITDTIEQLEQLMTRQELLNDDTFDTLLKSQDYLVLLRTTFNNQVNAFTERL